ncbi:hypothetical protein DPMN_010251 [Dreissena polymorpha]|uniref:Uncharacterized protein n=1 Tax=Dreissena polymorpha TaxID=45954 RepID=A0A9D4N2U3_DREPO|nr:hypothetical protein DPMN_010251 [Dreissena polymorpha]
MTSGEHVGNSSCTSGMAVSIEIMLAWLHTRVQYMYLVTVAISAEVNCKICKMCSF